MAYPSMKPKFSVIIPLYNKARYVAKAIDSVLVQTFADYELIIVDDGSKDNSVEVATRCIAGHENCQLIRQENAGVSMARNNGVKVSKGDYLCFLDADDWWALTFLEEMSNLIIKFPAAGIYGVNYTIVNEGNCRTRVASIGVEPDFEKGYINYCKVYNKTMYMPLWTGAVCIPRIVFDEMNGFPQGIKLGEDFLLWIRIALKYKVAFLNEPLAFYNQDVDVANRGVLSKGYEPDTFMTFYFNQFELEEKDDNDLKKLLDRLRVYTLLRFRLTNSHVKRVNEEIKKVNFDNVDKKYKLYYKLPYPIVCVLVKVHSILWRIKQYIYEKMV